jgi:hydroxypyruvate reductase/glycerate 2-kinase
MSNSRLRADARAIWDAAVAAVKPEPAMVRSLRNAKLRNLIGNARRIVVVGGGKAGAAMAAALEHELSDRLGDITGIVNVPAGTELPLHAIRLHAARPAGSNEPTIAGVEGSRQILEIVAATEPNDLVIALISGGGSALMPYPVDGVSLEDKQAVTRLLMNSGATIGEMNCVRKHLSSIKGGGLAAAARCPLIALIISDVIGDPLDVIASGPTAPDPTTFGDALAVLRKFDLADIVPRSAQDHLNAGAAGRKSETLKSMPSTVNNQVIARNEDALAAAQDCAESQGYRVHCLGSSVRGETRDVARSAVKLVTDSGTNWNCALIGGETTVALPPDHGKGGRNTEFVLAALIELEKTALKNFVVLSGGTDGEDGPTDVAGAIGDDTTLSRARSLALDPADFLRRHDSYSLFDATGDLIRTGFTGTNVMDVRVLLIGQK